jgi:hypothetical protein
MESMHFLWCVYVPERTYWRPSNRTEGARMSIIFATEATTSWSLL